MEWLDCLLEEGVRTRSDGGLAWHSLVRALVSHPRLAEGGVVRAVVYLLTAREEVVRGELAREEREALEHCARDLAAAVLRLQEEGREGREGREDRLKARLQEALARGELATAYQHQTDMSLQQVVEGGEATRAK